VLGSEFSIRKLDVCRYAFKPDMSVVSSTTTVLTCLRLASIIYREPSKRNKGNGGQRAFKRGIHLYKVSRQA